MQLLIKVIVPEELPMLSEVFGGAGRATLLEGVAQDNLSKGAAIISRDASSVVSRVDLSEEKINQSYQAVSQAFNGLNAAFIEIDRALKADGANNDDLRLPRFDTTLEYEGKGAVLTTTVSAAPRCAPAGL